uniref:Peptidase C2 calpain large subunit domain-containing protein n=1 Tax=Cacopsylla melanoneura TaxID=428564 RepID=A0A8D8T4Z0_9HEMI
MTGTRVMGCTPTKPNNQTYRTELFINSLVYNIHSSVPHGPPDPNETKILQEDVVDSVEDPKQSMPEFDPKHWLQRALQNMHSMQEKGHWIAGVTGGGSRNNVEMYTLNPQYQLSLLNRGSREVLIGLYQTSSNLLAICILRCVLPRY